MAEQPKGLGLGGLFRKGAGASNPTTPSASPVRPAGGAPELKSEESLGIGSASSPGKPDKKAEKAEKEKEKALAKLEEDQELMDKEDDEKAEVKKVGPKYLAKPGDYEVIVHVIEVRNLKGK
jgi:hypothetical protein